VTAFAAGLLLGLAGSAHCASMCGPLLLAVSGGGHGSRLLRILVYHGGRVLIYLAIGGAAGLAGHGLSSGGVGRGVSVIAGVVLVIVAAGSGARLIPHGASRFWSMSLSRASRAACRSRQKYPIGGQLLAGAVNGLLPCGLVYAAAVAAAGLGSVWTGLVVMAGFGAGTIPVLLLVTLSASSLPASSRARLSRLAPLALAVTGMLLIGRGVLPVHHGASVHAHPTATATDGRPTSLAPRPRAIRAGRLP
jgi:uncharacterized protein